MDMLDRPQPSLTTTATRARVGSAVAALCWCYSLFVVSIWLFIRLAGDRWWPATVVLFGPRWILLFPLIALLPLAFVFRRRWLLGLLGIAMLVLGPLADLRVTWKGISPKEKSASAIRILTLNTHFEAVNPVQLKQLIDQTAPDIIALQEWYPGNRGIVFPDGSWHTIVLPEAMLVSRFPIRWDGVTIDEPDVAAGVTYRYTVQLPGRNLSFYSVHLASPHTVFQYLLHLRRHGRAYLASNSGQRRREAIEIHGASDNDTILAGDFNLPRDSTIFRSELSGFIDAFADAGLGWGFTYYSRWTTVRIDHILLGKNWQCDRCWVGPDIGSPHRPVIADISRSS